MLNRNRSGDIGYAQCNLLKNKFFGEGVFWLAWPVASLWLLCFFHRVYFWNGHIIVCSCSFSLMTSNSSDNINLQYHPVLSCRPTDMCPYFLLAAHLISVGYPILIPNGPPNLSL